jgi:hypothetical protein
MPDERDFFGIWGDVAGGPDSTLIEHEITPREVTADRV